MIWYDYVACFFSGAFLANMVPHFVNGVSGNRFPTPFAKPPGRGLSSPFLNVIWSTVNLAIGCLLFDVGGVSKTVPLSIVLFASGAFLMSIELSRVLVKKHKE